VRRRRAGWSRWLPALLAVPVFAQVPGTGVPVDADRDDAPAYGSTHRVPMISSIDIQTQRCVAT
jgi:hypothetical protein